MGRGWFWKIGICKGRSCDTLFEQSLYPHYFGNKSFQLLSFILCPGYPKMENYWDFNDDRIAPIYRTSEEYKTLAELLTTYPTSKYSMWYGHFPPYFVWNAL